MKPKKLILIDDNRSREWEERNFENLRDLLKEIG